MSTRRVVGGIPIEWVHATGLRIGPARYGLVLGSRDVDDFCQALRDVRDDVDKPKSVEDVVEEAFRISWSSGIIDTTKTVANALRNAGLINE